MNPLDRTWPFVISHTRWSRPPKVEKRRHFRGYVAGTVKLLLNVNKFLIDTIERAIDDAYYVDEDVVHDRGSGVTRHWAFDVGVEYDGQGSTKPVLKAIETVRVPRCAHHYTINRVDDQGFHDEAPERDLADIMDPREVRRESQPVVEAVMEDLEVSSQEPRSPLPGEIVDYPSNVFRNGVSGPLKAAAPSEQDVFDAHGRS